MPLPSWTTLLHLALLAALLFVSAVAAEYVSRKRKRGEDPVVTLRYEHLATLRHDRCWHPLSKEDAYDQLSAISRFVFEESNYDPHYFLTPWLERRAEWVRKRYANA